MRADVYLAKHGHTKSRQSAKILIEEEKVTIDGVKIKKPSLEIDDAAEHSVVISEIPRFVSRGGEKLSFALDSFGIDVGGLRAIDVGASTGGFTDCLLKRGASFVYAVDSGHGQLDRSLQEDKRVISIEKYNARLMRSEDFPISFDMAVMDVSFISQTYIHKGIYEVLKDNGTFVSLIKPQFECGRNALNSKGIVKDPKERFKAVLKAVESAEACGFSCVDVIRSSIEGGDGNVEFLAHFVKNGNKDHKISENKIKLITETK